MYGDEHTKHFTALLSRSRGIIWTLCAGYSHGDVTTCRDLAHEVSIHLWTHFDKLYDRSTPKMELAWVWWQTRSYLSHRHRARRMEHVELTDNMPSDDSDNEARATLDELMSTLPYDDQRLLRLYLEGYSQKEITAISGISYDAVRQRMHRAIEKMKTNKNIIS